jgi:hypothetical protein
MTAYAVLIWLAYTLILGLAILATAALAAVGYISWIVWKIWTDAFDRG